MAAKFKITHIDKGLRRLAQVAKALAAGKAHVRVGVIGDGASENHGAVTNAELAAIHEYGAPSVGVPERSFIRSSFEAGKAEYRGLLKTGVKAFYAGKGDLQKTLSMIGQKMQSDMKRRIVSGAGIPPPLKPETVERKGSDRPLVDTGQLLQSISYEVKT